jgi:hypothetical protein
MIVSLSAKNKLVFIDGFLPKPSPEDEAMHHTWMRCNNMIITWILNSVLKEIASSIIYITTCEEMAGFEGSVLSRQWSKNFSTP